MSQRVVPNRAQAVHSGIGHASEILASSIPLVLAIYWFESLLEDPARYLAFTGPLILVCTALLAFYEGIGKQGNPAISTICLVTVITPITYALTILMGAPFTTHIPQTGLLSFHLSIMAFFRAFNILGPDVGKWLPLVPFINNLERPQTKGQFRNNTGRTGFEGPVWGTLLGAYLGAIPIPLDWDRVWQKWPITVYLGASAGLCLGTIISVFYNLSLMSTKDGNAQGTRGSSRTLKKLQ